MRSTVRRPTRSASGPARKMAIVALNVCEDTVQPSCKSLSANCALTNSTAPVNSDPSKPMRKPLSAMIRIVPVAEPMSDLGHGVPFDESGLEDLLHFLRLLVHVLENPARRHHAHVCDGIVDGGQLGINIARYGRIVEADDRQL